MAAVLALLVTAVGFGIVAAAALGLYVVLTLWLGLNVSYVGCSGLIAILFAAMTYQTYKYVTEEAPTYDED